MSSLRNFRSKEEKIEVISLSCFKEIASKNPFHFFFFAMTGLINSHVMKVFLLGFMGAGKTSIGKKLAKKLGFSFIDLDKTIEEKCGKSVSLIFAENGEADFREKEATILRNITNDKTSAVVSLGGGTPCYHRNMELVNSSGISIYIKLSNQSIFNRLKNAKVNRPLIKNMDDNSLHEFIVTKVKEREVFYNQADYIVKGESLKVESLMSLLLS